MPDPLNELTFAGWLTAFTASRAERLRALGETILIRSAEIEERQVDADGRVRRCDVRFNSESGRKLASGELKRPEVPEGRDPRNEQLRSDARRKALARGLPYYFTCNIATVVLYEVAALPSQDDSEIQEFALAPIARSDQAIAYRDQIGERWSEFLDVLEAKLAAIGRIRPTVTTRDIIAMRDAIYAVANETITRAISRVRDDPALADELRQESDRWPAPGFTDTELGVLMEPEVYHGATEVYEGVQA
jgi:hypothetical protein